MRSSLYTPKPKQNSMHSHKFFDQNADFLPKRLVFDRNLPPRAPEDTPQTPTPESRAETQTRQMNRLLSTSRTKIGELLDEEKRDKLLDTEEQSISPPEIYDNLKKILNEDDASSDWVRKTYHKLYPDLLEEEITAEVRRDIHQHEIERLKELLPEDMQERFRAATKKTIPPSYTEALRNIMSGRYHHVDKGEVKNAIANLNLSDAKTMECLKVQRELEEFKQKKKAIEANLAGLNAELLHVEHDEKNIKEWKEWWGKGVSKVWDAVGTGVKYGAIAAGVYGFFGLQQVLFTGGTSILGFAASKIGALLGATTWGGIGKITGSILGLSALKKAPEWVAGWHYESQKQAKIKALKKEREEKKEAAGWKELEKEEEHASHIVATHKATIKAKADTIETEKAKIVTEKNRISALLKAASKDEEHEHEQEIHQLQHQYELVSEQLLSVETILSVLRAPENPTALDPQVRLTEDQVAENLRTFKPDEKTDTLCRSILKEQASEWEKTQKKLVEVPEQEGIAKELEALEDQELLESLTQFLDPARARGHLSQAHLSSLRTFSPHLYTMVESFQHLPESSLLQTELRRPLHALVKKTNDKLRKKPSLEAVDQNLQAITDQTLRSVIETRPMLLRELDPTLPEPRARARLSLKLWKEQMTEEQLDTLTQLLQRVKTDYVFEANRLVDKMQPLKTTILQEYQSLERTRPALFQYLNGDTAQKLQKCAEKLSAGRTFQLAQAADFRQTITDTTDRAELTEVRNLLPKIKAKIDIDPQTGEPEIMDTLNREIGEAYAAIESIHPEVTEAINARPALLRSAGLSIDGQQVPEPGSPEAAGNYTTYLESLNLKDKKTLRAVLRKVKQSEYVPNKRVNPDALVPHITRLQDEILKTVREIDRELAASTAGTAHVKNALTADDFNKTMGIFRGRWNIGGVILSTTAANFEEALREVRDKDDLKEVKKGIEKIKIDCYYSHPKFASKHDVDDSLRHLLEPASLRDAVINQNVMREIKRNARLIRLNQLGATDLPEPTVGESLEAYLRRYDHDYIVREKVLEALKKLIGVREIPKQPAPDQITLDPGPHVVGGTTDQYTLAAIVPANSLVFTVAKPGADYGSVIFEAPVVLTPPGGAPAIVSPTDYVFNPVNGELRIINTANFRTTVAPNAYVLQVRVKPEDEQVWPAYNKEFRFFLT